MGKRAEKVGRALDLVYEGKFLPDYPISSVPPARAYQERFGVVPWKVLAADGTTHTGITAPDGVSAKEAAQILYGERWGLEKEANVKYRMVPLESFERA